MHTVFVTAFEHANHARVKIVKLVCLVPLEFRESINIRWLVRDKACGKGKTCWSLKVKSVCCVWKLEGTKEMSLFVLVPILFSFFYLILLQHATKRISCLGRMWGLEGIKQDCFVLFLLFNFLQYLMSDLFIYNSRICFHLWFLDAIFSFSVCEDWIKLNRLKLFHAFCLVS